MNAVSFFVPGEVVGKGRPRFTTVGRYTKAFTPEKTTNYENLVKLSYQEAYRDFRFPDDAQLVMEIVAVFPIPKSTSKKRAALMENGEIRKLDAEERGSYIATSLPDNGATYIMIPVSDPRYKTLAIIGIVAALVIIVTVTVIIVKKNKKPGQS